MKRRGVARSPCRGRSGRGMFLASGQSGRSRPEGTSSPHPRALHRLAWGIERIGLVALRFPLLAALLVLALSGGAPFAAPPLQVHASLSQLFRSEAPEAQHYEEASLRFPPTEFHPSLRAP